MDREVEAMLFKFGANERAKELMDEKPVEWQRGFSAACVFMADVLGEFIKIYFGGNDDPQKD